MSKNGSLLACAIIALALVGCGAQPGTTIVTQGRTGGPVMQTAPETGTYKLYTATSPNATTTVKLNAGDPLGFRKDEEGRIIAVGGTTEQPLSKATAQAYWKLQKK
jgi:hypothetical protein